MQLRQITFWFWRFSRFFRIALSTPLSYCTLLLNQVKIGKYNLFDGAIYVVNQPGECKITIGNYCRFNSSPRSNLIGINRPCTLSTHRGKGIITIGDYCGFSGTSISAFQSITLGNSVRCGANSVITDGDWHMDDPRIGEARPVVIHDNVWLGYGVIVLKGVEIGKNSIIGAGSVVVSDIPANVIASGNPCTVIKRIPVE